MAGHQAYSGQFGSTGHVVVLGKTRSGKSYLVKRAIEQHRGGVLTVDTKAERDWPGYYLTGRESLSGIYRDLAKGAHLAYVPSPDPEQALVALRKICLDVIRRRWKDLWLVVDEAQMYAPKGAAGPLDYVASQGQGQGVRLVAITQRAQMLSHTILTQAEQVYLFYMARWEDPYLKGYGIDGDALRTTLSDAGKYCYMVYDGAAISGPFREA